MFRISYRLCATFIVLPVPTGCAGLSWPQAADAQRAGAGSWIAPAAAGARYDFHWRLSGDKRIAPLQVFDDGARTWLHFAPGQAVPAIFADDGLAQAPVAYQNKPPYVVLDGKWPAIVLRAGGLQARAVYAGVSGPALDHHTANHLASKQAGGRAVAAGAAGAIPSAASAVTSAHHARPAPGTDHPAHAGRSTAVATGASQDASQRQAAGAASPQPAAGVYAALPGDGNMRGTLVRWARAAGWTFGPEHWDVDVDIPLAGSAAFGADFKPAVRGLIGATEMGDKPLQPCFYANQVLRVVAATHSCDRSASRTGEPV